MNDSMQNKNVYNSGLNDTDWQLLRDVFWPFVHTKNPSDVAIPEVPQHLANHPLVLLIKKYKETGNEDYLDQAGQHLVPTNKPFGWYVPLTK
jgi:hypothetical protein